MLLRFQASFVLGVCLVSIPAAAERPAVTADEPADDGASEDQPVAPAKPKHTRTQESTDAPADDGASDQPPSAQPRTVPPAADVTPEVKPAEELPPGFNTEVHGYFRAPMDMGISSRPGPDNMTGPSSTQVSYGPNRTVDSSYYSFAYTRLQEQDWAEVFIHAKKKHVDAAVAWMGYWFQAVGFRNYDGAWAPALAYVALDSDVEVAGIKPNVAFTMGAFWPSFGYFEKYDTYTLGRFRQLGAQLKLTIPINSDLALTVTGGFGTNRDGSFNPGAPAFYGAIVGLDLLTYINVKVAYQNYFDVGLHFNTEWSADPNLTPQGMLGPKSYTAVQQAHLSVVGGEANVRAPYAGHLWVSPSMISVRNGWALGSAGTEVMHSLNGAGIATNYMAWTDSPSDSTGSGSMLNLGFLYENSLSNVMGGPPRRTPDVTVSAFGLLADAKLDLPVGTTLTQNSIKQFKYGVDATLQALTWLAFMARYDLVNYDLDHPGLIFSSVTGRAIISSHFLSSERIYIQYSRYTYGDKMVLNGTWPWGAPLVAGANVLQEGPYSGMKPDANVVKLQAEVAF